MPALALSAALLAGAAAPASLAVHVEQLRNQRGLVRLCLTRDPNRFPDCRSDPAAVGRSVPAHAAADMTIDGLTPGSYALSLLHDENGNGRLDTLLKVPREGFGFSRNPAIRFGPPRFSEVRFTLSPGANRQTVRMRYLL